MTWKASKTSQFLALLACLFCFDITAAAPDDQKATEQQLNQLKKNISDLQGWLQSAEGKRGKLQQQLRQSEVEIGRTTTKIKALSDEIKVARNKLQSLKKRRSDLLDLQQQQEQLLSQQIRAAYQIGRQEYLKVLLNQEQPDRVARALTYYEYFNQARTRQIEGYQQTLTELQENEQAIKEETTKLEEGKYQLEERRTTLNTSKRSRQKILVQLEGNIENKGEELTKLVADRKRLEELLIALEKALAEIELPDAETPIKQLRGNLPWPTLGKVTKRFGSTDRLSKTKWNGILISSPEGEGVTAIHHGRVVFADWLRGFGLLIIIDHGQGYMSLYGYNLALYKQTGDWVSPNEIIASVGKSGGRKNAGLYFEIRHNGKPQNPQKWILARR